MEAKTILILVTVLEFVVWGLLYEGRLPLPYSRRSCQGRAWRNQYPGKSSHEIREFLDTFVQAFAYGSKDKLNPDDQIIEIYRSQYTNNFQVDVMELETLELDIKNQFQIDLKDIWHESMTLGELFEFTNESRQ